MFKIHNGNHKYCNININKIKLKEGRKDETYLVEFDGMLVGKFHIIIFSLLAKTGSVGPVEQLIKLVSPNNPLEFCTIEKKIMFYNVILLEKLCKKVLYSMAKLFFNQKLFHFFCQNVPSSIHSIYGILYTLYGSECRFFTLCGSECREEKKKGKTWRNEVDTKTVKIATSEIHISILKRNYTIL